MTDTRLATTVAAALTKCATSVDATARQRWAFTLANGTELAARACVRDGWLALEALLQAAEPALGDVWELLEWNATLGGGVRFAPGPGGRGTCARAELPLDDDVDLGRRILETCAGLKAASHLLGGTAETPVHRTADDLGPDGLRDLCRASGWPVIERDAGLLAVDLDVPDAFQQALVELRADGAVAVAAPLLADAAPPAEPITRQAVGLLLLRVCAVVRMARGTAERRGGTPHARLEVVFESAPCAAELAHAFAALSVACRVASREAAVLWGNARIARAYVAQWEQDKEDNHGTGSSSEDGRAAGE